MEHQEQSDPLRHLKSQLALEQHTISYLERQLQQAVCRRNETFQALQQVTWGFKPGDRIKYQGKEKVFRGKVTGYAADDALRTDSIMLWFDCDDGAQYNIAPKDAQLE